MSSVGSGQAWLAWLVAAILTGCAPQSKGRELPRVIGDSSGEPWRTSYLPGAHPGRHLSALARAAAYAPVRMRVWVIPGSGCAGMGPVASRYFAGLLHAEIIVLHKNGVSPTARGSNCDRDFLRDDALSLWRDDIIAALAAVQTEDASSDTLPQWIVGISEGGELAPYVAPVLRNLQGVVLVSSAGIDPIAVASRRLSIRPLEREWAEVIEKAARPLPGTLIVQGRSLRYWRDFLDWRTADLLHVGNWPLLQAWGTDDEVIPRNAYDEFARQQVSRASPYCALKFVGANHNLQGPDGRDGIQRLWAVLDKWARDGVMPCADPQVPEIRPN